MNNFDSLIFKKEIITLDGFKLLRMDAGWLIPSDIEINAGLSRSLFGISVFTASGEIVGMGRVVGDGFLQVFLSDVIVLSGWKKIGIGSKITKMLMEFIKFNVPNEAFVGLFSAVGLEEMYKKHGFISRPNKTLGAGMVYYGK